MDRIVLHLRENHEGAVSHRLQESIADLITAKNAGHDQPPAHKLERPALEVIDKTFLCIPPIWHNDKGAKDESACRTGKNTDPHGQLPHGLQLKPANRSSGRESTAECRLSPFGEAEQSDALIVNSLYRTIFGAELIADVRHEPKPRPPASESAPIDCAPRCIEKSPPLRHLAIEQPDYRQFHCNSGPQQIPALAPEKAVHTALAKTIIEQMSARINWQALANLAPPAYDTAALPFDTADFRCGQLALASLQKSASFRSGIEQLEKCILARSQVFLNSGKSADFQNLLELVRSMKDLAFQPLLSSQSSRQTDQHLLAPDLML